MLALRRRARARRRTIRTRRSISSAAFPRHHRRHFRPRGRRQDGPDPRPADRRSRTRRGAASSIAAAYVARAPKDGYTLVRRVRRQHDQRGDEPNLSFDIMKDFAPITLITSTPTVLVVTPELGVKSVKELIALAKAKPGTISFGSSGVGSSTHLALELFKSLAHVNITHIPYTGSPQVVTDLLAGRIHGYFSPASTVVGACPGRQADRARRHRSQAQLVLSRSSDHDRSRRAGLRIGAVVRHRGAGGHAAADHRQAVESRQRGVEVGRGRQIAAARRRSKRSAARRTNSASIWRPSRSAGTPWSRTPA